MINLLNNFVCSEKMPLLKGQILKEMALSSKYNCAFNGSSLEFVLPENINFGEKKVYVGVKNFKMPKVEKEITIKKTFFQRENNP